MTDFDPTTIPSEIQSKFDLALSSIADISRFPVVTPTLLGMCVGTLFLISDCGTRLQAARSAALLAQFLEPPVFDLDSLFLDDTTSDRFMEMFDHVSALNDDFSILRIGGAS